MKNMSIDDLKHSDITQKVIGCAFKVHNKLGNGFMEIVYQRALAIEMEKVGLNFSREPEIPIYYDGEEIGIRRVDFIIEKNVILELKAVSNLDETHLAQSLNYLEAFNFDTGLIINFGAPSLNFKRLINSKFKNKSMQSVNVQEIRGSNP